MTGAASEEAACLELQRTLQHPKVQKGPRYKYNKPYWLYVQTLFAVAENNLSAKFHWRSVCLLAPGARFTQICPYILLQATTDTG